MAVLDTWRPGLLVSDIGMPGEDDSAEARAVAGPDGGCYRRLVSRVVLALLLLVAVGRADETASERRTIVVTGQGEVKGRPDRLAVSFAVETTAARAGDAGAENARRSAAVAAAVKPLLAADDAIVTSRYVVEPRYEPARPGEPHEPRIVGYVARNEVRVTSREVEKAGALIDAATGAGANRVGGLEFTVADRAALLRAAIEQAGADARAQAESLAKSLGVRLVRVVMASTSSGPTFLPRRFDTMEMAAAKTAPTPIEPGEATVTATVQVTWQIE